METIKNLIGIDLGGTNLRAGKVINDKIVQQVKTATRSDGTVEEVVDQIIQLIDSCIDKGTNAIGVGVPSVVDVDKGIVYDVVNIPSWKEVALKEMLESRFKIPVFVNNDANCFVVGEKYFGKGKPYKNIVGVTLGTGLGCGLIFNNKLYEGSNCGAGEFGNIPYLAHNVEYYCSGQFFTDEKKVAAIDMFNKAKAGDQAAREMFDEYGFHLGQVLKSILYAYDPEIIILGGSVAKSFEYFKDAMFHSLQDFAYSSVLANLKIDRSVLENSAIFGAAALPMIKQ